MRKYVVPLLCAILFCIPFFWLKPGEMDLGGDSSRLYYYDPLAYLLHLSFSSISPSGIGGEAISFYAIPFVSYLAVMKAIFVSPTILIFIQNGMSLSLSFLAIYLIVKELTKGNAFLDKRSSREYAAIIAGIFYIFSPMYMLGWDKALLTHDQIFLNPLMFFLLLKFFLTRDKRYLISSLLISFLFAYNFDFVGAPPFFAFYPLALSFLLIYVRYIRGVVVRFRDIVLGLVLFLLLHAFHLFPQIVSLFSAGSSTNAAVFSGVAFSRGIDYFSAIAPTTKVGLNVMNLPQVIELGFLSFGFIIFPFLILLGFLWNKERIMLLTGIFFLVAMFFESANITHAGLAFYKSLFNLPGFAMFRNFFGQWAFVFSFFYTLLLGQSLFIIFQKLSVKKSFVLGLGIVLLLTANAWPFLTGSLFTRIHYQSNNVKTIFQMDPTYENALGYLRALPVDGKVLSFPLTGPGYQMIAGKYGGAYQGPSTISYLAGKNDFTGYDGLIPFNETFLTLVRNRDYQGINKLFSFLNIKYIFYNSDPLIYDTAFPKFPYDGVRDVMPKDQKAYKAFITKLPIHKIKDFGDKYHVYEVDTFLPHIYSADDSIYSDDPLVPFILNFKNAPRSVILPTDAMQEGEGNAVFDAINMSPFVQLQNNYHLHSHAPYISKRMDDILYPFIIWREDHSLRKMTADPVNYVDFSLLYLTKRIFELNKYDQTPVTYQQFKQPQLWEIYRSNEYYSWESTLDRYQKQANVLMEWLPTSGLSESDLDATKIKINEAFSQNEISLLKMIRNRNNEKEKAYLLPRTEKVFESLYNTLHLKIHDAAKSNYTVDIPKSMLGEYEVYLKSPTDEALDPSSYTLKVGDTSLLPLDTSTSSAVLDFNTAKITKEPTSITLFAKTKNILSKSWKGSANVKENLKEKTFTFNNVFSVDEAVSNKLSNYKPNTQYLVTFDYKTSGDDFTFQIFEKQLQKNKIKKLIYFDRNLYGMGWKTNQSVFTSSSNIGYIQFTNVNEKNASNLEIRNLSVSPIDILNEQIILKKVIKNEKKSTPPNVHFTKINSTKYKVRVMGANDPYTLVFSEAFSPKWKLYLQNDPSQSNDALGGSSLNSFLDFDIFRQSSGKSIATENHVSANGYANAWTIQPEDVGGKRDYELILSYEPQKYFYIGFVVSLISLFLACLYLLVSSLRKKHEKK